MENAKRIAAITSAIVILFSVICIPVAADPTSGEYAELAVTGILGDSSDSWSIATPLAGDQESGNALRVGADQHNTTAFIIYRSSVKKVRFVSTIQNTNCYIMARWFRSGEANYLSSGATYTCSNSIVFNDVTYYYCDCTWNYIPSYAKVDNAQLPYYDNISQESATSEACNFLYGVVNPPLVESGYFSLNLNPGYVAFIDITDLTGVNVSLDTTLFGGADWNNHLTDQNIGLVNSMPSSFSLPLAGTNHINWSGTGNKNILGQYKSFKANYTYSTVGSTTYLVVVNPLQARMDAQLTAMASMPSQRNNPIFITVSQARTCKIYSLTASLAVGSGNLDIETNGETYSGTNDGDGNWTYTNDDTGSTIDPDTLPIGGGNDPIIGQETSINDWLQNIANQIKGFFSGAVGAVTTLVSAGSAFINSLVGLYSWLPAPVYSVLSAALIIVITVGVIKVFI